MLKARSFINTNCESFIHHVISSVASDTPGWQNMSNTRDAIVEAKRLRKKAEWLYRILSKTDNRKAPMYCLAVIAQLNYLLNELGEEGYIEKTS